MLFFTLYISCFASIIIRNGQCETVQVEKETIAQNDPRSDYFRNDFTRRDSLVRSVSFEEEKRGRGCEEDPCKNNGMCIDAENGFNCICQSPYFGKTCEENPCSSRPCLNGGECQIEMQTYKCICKTPFLGDRCERDPCTPNPCENEGKCSIDGYHFNCTCVYPYSGEMCEIGPCYPNPCQNNGECEIDGDRFRCMCKGPFIGDTCENELCSPNPCLNNGTCTHDETNFACSCISPFYGIICDKGPCEPNPCLNDGMCMSDGEKFKCTCKPPFYGERCEKDNCSPNPCLNGGKCFNLRGNFKCICPFPFYGERCEIDSCTPNPCLNGGKCLNERGNFKCICPHSFYGERCEINPCTSNPCLNGGKCLSGREEFHCLCPLNFRGERCEKIMEITTQNFRTSTLMGTTVSTNPCDSNPCKNDGICTTDGEKMKCLCFTPFYGEYCESGPCYPNPCKNGGKCEITERTFQGYEQGTYRCSCPESFIGDNCEIGNEVITTTENFRTSTLMTTMWTTPSTSSCDLNPCKNDGVCKIEDEKTKCLCLEPFWGEYCEIEKETTTQNIRTSTLMTTMLTTPSTKCDCGEKSSDCFLNANGVKRCICLPGYAQIKGLCSDCYCGMQSLSCRFNSTGDKICQCKPGYSQKSRACVEICASDSDCLNGGLCKRFENGSFCECRTHFIGDKCETSTVCDELRERCKSIGSVCTQRNGKATCECPPHKTYVLQTGFCEDICDSTKCLHGKCEIVGKSYRCRCDEGFSGSRCDEKIVADMNIPGFLIFLLVFCNVIVTSLIGIFFCACRNRRLKNKVADQ